jgi:hypothetical protein
VRDVFDFDSGGIEESRESVPHPATVLAVLSISEFFARRVAADKEGVFAGNTLAMTGALCTSQNQQQQEPHFGFHVLQSLSFVAFAMK